MKQFANQLEANQAIQTTFLVLHKEIRQKKTGEPYLSLTLGDKSGDVDAKMWDHVAEVMDTFDRHDFVKVRGLTAIYQNRMQLTVHKLQRADDREIDKADYFPASTRNRDEMFAELRQHVAAMTNPHLKALIEAFLADPALVEKFKTAPAAKTIHHAWIGGLLEHVLSLATLAKFTAAHYPGVDADLLLTGVILHDIGKIDELTYDRGFGYSDEGQLVGHILIGLRMVDDKVRQVPGFPPKLKLLVEHLVASHHGEFAYGSPKVPATLEAMLLHHLDNLDSKVETVRQAVERDTLVDGNWSVYIPSLERSLLKQQRYLRETPTPPAGPPARPDAARPATDFAAKLSGALLPKG
jgi:3'-5' exoribonuclease